MEVTKNFKLVHATVTYPDGREENVEYWSVDEQGSTITIFEYDDNIWHTHASGNGEVYLMEIRTAENTTTYSTHNIEKIEPRWAEELVVVADVPVEEQTTTKLFGLLSDTDYVVPEDYELDVEIVMRDDWEIEERQSE